MKWADLPFCVMFLRLGVASEKMRLPYVKWFAQHIDFMGFTCVFDCVRSNAADTTHFTSVFTANLSWHNELITTDLRFIVLIAIVRLSHTKQVWEIQKKHYMSLRFPRVNQINRAEWVHQIRTKGFLICYILAFLDTKLLSINQESRYSDCLCEIIIITLTCSVQRRPQPLCCSAPTLGRLNLPYVPPAKIITTVLFYCHRDGRSSWRYFKLNLI